MLDKVSNSKFIALRKRRIELEYQDLNEMQRKAVLETEGPLLLLAGAGSGKTTVLINRIANLIRFGSGATSKEVPDFITDEDYALLERYMSAPSQDIESRINQICAVNPAAPWSIIAITFTNKAAKELKERLARAIGDAANDVWASTFHSSCVRILRRDIDRLGFEKSFTIYDAADSERLIKDILKENQIDDKLFPPKSVLGEISRAKDKMQSPDMFKNNAGSDLRLSEISKVYEIYQKRLRIANALDFDDIIMHTVTLLLKFSEVREYYQKKFKYVLVDEYQDTNHAQYLLASTLSGGYDNICVVGDDDQSIYRFRGATVENILEFENRYKGAKAIRLEQNYRSSTNILNIANSVISHNRGRKEKKLWTENPAGDLPSICRTQSETTEGQMVADKIVEEYSKGKGKWSDFAILYRINAQSNQLENGLKRRNVPYRIIGGTRFFDHTEIKDMLSYLWVVHNPSDTLRIKRIINVPARKIGQKTIEAIDELSRENNMSFFEVLDKAAVFSELHRALPQLQAFATLIDSLRALVNTIPLSELYDKLVAESGYIDALIAKDDIKTRTRIENIQELKSNIIMFENESEEPTLGAFLDEVSLFTDIEKYDADSDAVVMMTIHSSKGLEFPTVFMCGLEEGVFPGYRSIGSDEEMEEERRLFYVAVTRARKSLYITYAQSRMLFGQTTYNRPSRFLEEIPSESVRTVDEVPESEQSDGDPNENQVRPVRASAAVNKYQRPHTSSVAKKTAKLDNFTAGDKLRHKSFGSGIVVSAKPIGNDILLEISFGKVGTKRLLQKTAGEFLSRES